MDRVAYGVFGPGSTWSVVSEDGTKRAAAQALSVRRADSPDAGIAAPDELGLLTSPWSPHG